MGWKVQVNALQCLGYFVQWLDKQVILEILLTLQRCIVVDHSTPTLMCTLDVASAIYKQVFLFISVCFLISFLHQ